MLDETQLLLDLLHEAGDEPVTLDELHVVGVMDPAAALLALERAGHAVHRVYDTAAAGRNVACVRLGTPSGSSSIPAAPPSPARAPSTARPAAAAAAVNTARRGPSPAAAGAIGGLVLLLVVALVRLASASRG